MFDNDMNDMPSRSDEPSSSVSGYLNSAEQAAEQGNLMLALHLYLAAFERGQAAEGAVPSEAAIAGLKRAWRLACTLKERSIAEYVFERMEPYLSSDEVAACLLYTSSSGCGLIPRGRYGYGRGCCLFCC